VTFDARRASPYIRELLQTYTDAREGYRWHTSLEQHADTTEIVLQTFNS